MYVLVCFVLDRLCLEIPPQFPAPAKRHMYVSR